MAGKEFEVEARRIRVEGRYDDWRARVEVICPVEGVTMEHSPKEVIDRVKEEFPHIPRHEIAIVGWPTPRQWPGAEGGVV